MCGFAGILAFRAKDSAETLTAQVGRMRDALSHRGPDDAGVWVDERAGIALGHRRLSIIDLSPLGHQPMRSSSSRYVIAYNGEIYNHRELRSELEDRGASFRGHSDTEVLLAAVEAWGVERALERLNGMFAFAIWDCDERALFLARDRFGEKPLYYALLGDVFVFGSELKAIREHPAFDRDVDRRSLVGLLRYLYVPSPFTIHQGVFKLPPATWTRIASPQDVGRPPRPYWSAEEVARKQSADRFAGSERECIDALDAQLRRSIGMRMVADVPLGAFLSGGIDSSTVVALMQAQSTQRVKTFTIGFAEEAYDEARAAKEVARHLGTDHTELYVTPREALDVIPRLPHLYDEPFADSSQIPTFLVSTLARKHVTVALSGDGGDEIFGGYNRYAWAENIWRALRPFPHSARRALARTLTRLPPSAWDDVFARARPLLPSVARVRLAGDKMHKLAGLLPARNSDELYRWLLSTWKEPADVVLGGEDPPAPHLPPLATFTEQMMLLDTRMYLPDDILVKVDRAAMGVSLETRVPLLDPEVFALAWSLPLTQKIRSAKGKLALRAVLRRYVPDALFERPKMGFGIPIDHWLRGELRPWADELLSDAQLTRDGFFDPVPIREKWREHVEGTRNWQHYLWPILMFQSWRESQGRSSDARTSRGSDGMLAPPGAIE